MEKPAPTNHPIHDLLRQRWSPRAFAPRPVEREKLLSLLEAARWAPSSFNEQPWSFIVATKEVPAEFEQLLNCLVDFNQGWAKAAPVLMFSVARLTFSRNDKPNRHAYHDIGLATENLALQAVALGLVAHQMAGFDGAKAREVFAIPAGFEPVAAIAVGYQGNPTTLPEKMRQGELAPRERKPMADFVFTGRWGKTSPVVSAVA